jgi:replicative DNA helicase
MAKDQNDRLREGTLPHDPAIDTELMPDPDAPRPPRSIRELLGPALALAKARRDGKVKPIPVPWREYANALAGGLWPGMHVLVAGTGAGKTAFALQEALEAAKARHPVCYVGLELDEPQIALRLLAEHARMSWSKLYLGQSDKIEQAEAKASELEELPFYVETGPPGGWPASHLSTIAEGLRAAHPNAGTLLLVVDFLQLVGDETGQSKRELRERIGRAAYQAREVARRYDAAVLLVSSAARDNYKTLCSECKDAHLGTVKTTVGQRRTIFNPDVLVGLGKESGEIEYAADSVTVLVRWPQPLDNGDRCILVAIPKLRYGPPTWVAFAFDGHRFVENTSIRTVEDFPEVPKRKPTGTELVSSNDDSEPNQLEADTESNYGLFDE